jgi:hypothetical protein
LPLGIKDPLKEKEGLLLLLLAFVLRCEAFAFGFCFLLEAFWCGKLLEGKRIAGELLKGNC